MHATHDTSSAPGGVHGAVWCAQAIARLVWACVASRFVERPGARTLPLPDPPPDSYSPQATWLYIDAGLSPAARPLRGSSRLFGRRGRESCRPACWPHACRFGPPTPCAHPRRPLLPWCPGALLPCCPWICVSAYTFAGRRCFTRLRDALPPAAARCARRESCASVPLPPAACCLPAACCVGAC